MTKSIQTPAAWYLLFSLMMFQGISGLFGGAALVWDPSGSLLSLPFSFLDGTPFSDYLLPGIILFTVLGIFPLVVLFGLWHRHTWSWLCTLLVSIALIVWIMVEMLMIGYQSDPPLQLVYGFIGLLLLVLVFLPSIRDELIKKGRRKQGK